MVDRKSRGAWNGPVSLTREELAPIIERALAFRDGNGTQELVAQGLMGEGEHASVANGVALHLDRYVSARRRLIMGAVIGGIGVVLLVILLILRSRSRSTSNFPIANFTLIGSGMITLAMARREMQAAKDSMITSAAEWTPSVSM